MRERSLGALDSRSGCLHEGRGGFGKFKIKINGSGRGRPLHIFY
jgi:hypothetical protein